jgi:hypothetical protein
MAKQYTYFRKPNGKAYRGTDGKYAPINLLSEIGKMATLNAEGVIQWTDLSIVTLEVALRSAFVVLDSAGQELNESDAWSIVRGALTDLLNKAPGRPVNPKALICESDKLAAAFFRKSATKYILVSSLSIADLPAKNISMQSCSVSALKSRQNRFPLPATLAVHGHATPFFDHLRSSKYRLVKVTTEGRSIHQAADNALNSLNLLRGLWSLFATYGSFTMRFNSPLRKPIGVIHTGPIHTLHFTDGRPVDDDLFWYEPTFTQEQDLFKYANRWKEIEKNRRWAMRRLAVLDYRSDLEALLIRYAGALDQPDMEVAFLHMWSILERITNTISSNYDEMINRVVWSYWDVDRPIARDILQTIRYRRNEYVHSGKVGRDGDRAAYLIKSFVDPHLLKLISNPFKIRSLDEYGEFLALPTDRTMLAQRRKNLAKALRVLSVKKRTK